MRRLDAPEERVTVHYGAPWTRTSQCVSDPHRSIRGEIRRSTTFLLWAIEGRLPRAQPMPLRGRLAALTEAGTPDF
jgi:hypothetical protein